MKTGRCMIASPQGLAYPSPEGCRRRAAAVEIRWRIRPPSGRPEELPHHRAVRLAPGHDLETVPGEGGRDPGKHVAGMRRQIGRASWRERVEVGGVEVD